MAIAPTPRTNEVSLIRKNKSICIVLNVKTLHVLKILCFSINNFYIGLYDLIAKYPAIPTNTITNKAVAAK